ncbi:hypothetical protein GWL_05030 [Herbaspirillum sp. GW103]|nr:hypothetical protein GWL_05030 [Herbaspirillum sp. GW103]
MRDCGSVHEKDYNIAKPAVYSFLTGPRNRNMCFRRSNQHSLPSSAAMRVGCAALGHFHQAGADRVRPPVRLRGCIRTGRSSSAPACTPRCTAWAEPAGLHHATADGAQFCAEKRGQIAIRLRIGGSEDRRSVPHRVHHRWGSVAGPACGRARQRKKAGRQKPFI